MDWPLGTGVLCQEVEVPGLKPVRFEHASRGINAPAPSVGADRYADFGQLGAMRIRSRSPRSSTTNAGELAGTATMPRDGRSTGSKSGPANLPAPAAANRYDNPRAGSPLLASVSLERLPATCRRSTRK